jgi:hypothetical protein
MLPQETGRKGHYVASGEWDLLGGGEKRVGMVAGERFEPAVNARNKSVTQTNKYLQNSKLLTACHLPSYRLAPTPAALFPTCIM